MNFKETEGALPCSQELATDCYPQPDESSLPAPFTPNIFLSGLLNKILAALIISVVLATYPTHHMPRDFIILLMFGKE
jgi:hypothetical protein